MQICRFFKAAVHFLFTRHSASCWLERPCFEMAYERYVKHDDMNGNFKKLYHKHHFDVDPEGKVFNPSHDRAVFVIYECCSISDIFLLKCGYAGYG